MMIKIILLFLPSIFLDSTVIAQDLFFKGGMNLTSYEYQNKVGLTEVGLNSRSGSTYQIGLGFPISLGRGNQYGKNRNLNDGQIRLRNEILINVNEYNAQGGDQNSNYTYETTYGGVNNQLSILANMGQLEFGILGSIGVNKIMSGTQVINAERYNLKDYQEFQRAFLHLGLGASIAYPILENLFLSVAYQHTKNMRPRMQNTEHVNFKSKVILFGIHFKIN